MNQHRDTDLRAVPETDGPGEDNAPEYTEEERRQDRAALVKELRAQVMSGDYKPSIGRISMNIFSNIAND